MGSAPYILLIEDDHDIRVTLREVLEADGYLVFSAGDGKSGFDLLRSMEKKPSLILLDLMMPVMSGLDFLSAIQPYSELRDIPVLIMSAASKQMKIPGTLGFVAKPIDLPHILQLVRDGVGGIQSSVTRTFDEHS